MKKTKAFTLIELMVVITIIAILSAVAVVGLTSIQQKALDTGHLAGIRDIQISLEAYKSVNNFYPDAGTQGSATYIAGNSTSPFVPAFIGKLPFDKGQSESVGYQYVLSSDKKSYCVLVKGAINKPESQPDMTSATCKTEKTWEACKGSSVSSISHCGVSAS